MLDSHMIMILVLGLLAWDVLRRFAASKPDQDELNELETWIEGMAEEARVFREKHDQVLQALEERVSKHAETLNRLGLAKLGKPGAGV